MSPFPFCSWTRLLLRFTSVWCEGWSSKRMYTGTRLKPVWSEWCEERRLAFQETWAGWLRWQPLSAVLQMWRGTRKRSFSSALSTASSLSRKWQFNIIWSDRRYVGGGRGRWSEEQANQDPLVDWVWPTKPAVSETTTIWYAYCTNSITWHASIPCQCYRHPNRI